MLYEIAAILATLLALTATVLPVFRASYWWIRICDFLRFQIAVFGVLLAACWAVDWLENPAVWKLLFWGMSAAVVSWQTIYVWPFLKIANSELSNCKLSPDNKKNSLRCHKFAV